MQFSASRTIISIHHAPSSYRQIHCVVCIGNHRTYVVLIQALIHRRQINVIAVLRSAIPLRDLIVECRGEITRHETIHGKVIYRRGLCQTLWLIIVSIETGGTSSTNSRFWLHWGTTLSWTWVRKFVGSRAVRKWRISLVLEVKEVLILGQLILLLWFPSLRFRLIIKSVRFSCSICSTSELFSWLNIVPLDDLMSPIRSQSTPWAAWLLLLSLLKSVSRTCVCCALLPPESDLAASVILTHLLLLRVSQTIEKWMTKSLFGG